MAARVFSGQLTKMRVAGLAKKKYAFASILNVGITFVLHDHHYLCIDTCYALHLVHFSLKDCYFFAFVSIYFLLLFSGLHKHV